MTSIHGRQELEPLREQHAHPRLALPLPPRGELRARARPRSWCPALRGAEGAAESRAGRPGGGPVRRPYASLPARSALLRPRRPQGLPPTLSRAGDRAAPPGRDPPPPSAPHRQAPVTLSGRSSLAAVAAAVAAGLREYGIQAVLTGGACASLYSAGAYHSRDLDFVVIGGASQSRMDSAMASDGLVRRPAGRLLSLGRSTESQRGGLDRQPAPGGHGDPSPLE